MDDLVKRLRSVDVSWSETGEWCAEAADRIEELETELDRCRMAMAVMDNTVAKQSDFQTAVAYDCGIRAGQEEERAAIVAWLRSDRIVLSMDGSAEDVAASAIEAGEHTKC